MKSILCFLTLLLGSVSGLATAQTPIPQFTPQFHETFEVTPGATTQFPGFPPLLGGPNQALFMGTTPGGILIKSQNTQMLPPFRHLTCLFGRGTDVRILFDEPMRRFGGFFSQTNLAGAPTAVRFDFFLIGNQVGTVTVALPPTGGPGTSAYIGLFFDLAPTGYDRVDIIGIGGTFPGFVGMDELMATF